MDTKRFLGLFDLHYGFERRSGHKVALHDTKAMNVALEFAKDFKPDVVILGGDILDCGCLSHHNRNKPGRTEGMRIVTDAKECRENFIDPLEKLKAKEYVYILGNHDGGWLSDFEEDNPATEGMFNVRSLMNLDDRWNVIEQGGYYNLGKLTFIHGDTLSGEHCAKNGVIAYERNLRFGHFHGYSAHTKSSPIETKYPRTGVSVPCLCRRNPNYGGNRPNKWSQGFQWGYVFPDGTFTDYTTIMIDGKFAANGKVYGG